MERIRGETRIDGRKCWTLFDSGSRNTYITRKAAKGLQIGKLPAAGTVKLGGKTHRISQGCWLKAEIEGHAVDTNARIIG